MSGYAFEITHQFRGKGKMDEAEDWIQANIKGLWALEFLGMQEEVDSAKGTKSHVLHVRFKFGRNEDLNRFRDEYIMGKAPTAQARRKAPPKKGFWQRLLGS